MAAGPDPSRQADSLRARIARWLLIPWLGPEDRLAVVDDLEALATTRGSLYFWLELARYPFYLIFRSGHPRFGGHPHGGGSGGLERWLRELRLAVRRLGRSPGTSAVVIVTLALGIASSAAVFSVMSVLTGRSLPFGSEERLVRLRETVSLPGREPRVVVAGARNFHAVQERSTQLEELAAARFRTFAVSDEGGAERVTGLTATWNHFRVLDVEPLLGRTYGPDEDRAGAPAPVVVLSHSLWTRRFGQDPDALGQDLVLNGRAYTVIGVMPPGFRYPYAGELWVPMGLDPASPTYDTDRFYNVSARLAEGATFESAARELDRIASELQDTWPDTNRGVGFSLVSLRDEVLEGVPQRVMALMAAAVFVLLIGAANVTSILLARLEREEREATVRLALGARRWDLVRRLTAEALVLALAGGALGLGLAVWTVGPLAGMSPVDDLGPYFQQIRIDGRVVAFGVGLSLMAALLSALPGALRVGRHGLGSSLRGSRGTGGRRRGRGFLEGLVAGEVAVAFVLLTGAGLLLQSARNLWQADVGMDVEGLVTFGVSPSTAGYADVPSRLAWVDEVLERIRALPEVDGAGLTNFNPFRDQGWGAAVWPEGRDPDGPDDRLLVNHRAVTPGFFEAAGTRLLAGRTFSRQDGPGGAPVAIVSRAAAERFWPGTEAVGRRIRSLMPEGEGPWMEVVGVVEDVADMHTLTETWYLPLAQSPGEFNTAVLEIFVRPRAGMGLDRTVAAVREVLRDVDAEVPVFEVGPVADVLRFERRVGTFATVLLALFAGVGITLAAVGIYGVLAYAVGRRTHEIGLRLALGARPGGVMAKLVGEMLAVCLAGLFVGLLGAWLLTGFLEAFLVGVAPLEPTILGTMAVGALVVAAVAASVPARRALTIDPRLALAEE